MEQNNGQGTSHGTTVPSIEDLSAELEEQFALSADERETLNDDQRRARSLYIAGMSLRDAATELEGTEGCSYSRLRKLSSRFTWSRYRERFNAIQVGGANAILADRAASAAIRSAESVDFPGIPETPEQIQARHFHTSTRILKAVEESLNHYDGGRSEQVEKITEKGGESKETPKGKKSKKTSAGSKEKTKRKWQTALTVGHLKQLSEVARVAMSERRKAAGIEDDDAPREDPVDAATLALYRELSDLDDQELKDMIERELDDEP